MKRARRNLIKTVRQLASNKASPGVVAARSQDCLYGDDGLPAEAILPVEAFEAFKAAVEAPGKKIPGLARAAKATKGSPKDAG